MTRYVLGIDGGGTKTLAMIADENGRVRGSGQGGPSNYDDIGVERARAHIADAVAAARCQAGFDAHSFDAAFLGMAGVVSATDRDVMHAIAADLALAVPERVGVDHDCRIALAGGLSGRPGIVLIAGTGSSCYGRNAQGHEWRAGGWGNLISDEGSGYWLGVRALESAVRAFDGRGTQTVLTERVPQALGITDFNDIMHRLYAPTMPRAEIAELARLVLDAAVANDRVARCLIERAASDLADCVYAVAKRLTMDAEPSELALVGGMFMAGDTLFAPFRAALATYLPMCQITLAEQPPAVGACLLAQHLL